MNGKSLRYPLCLLILCSLASQVLSLEVDGPVRSKRLSVPTTTALPRTAISGAYQLGRVVNGKQVATKSGIDFKLIRNRMDRGGKVLSGIVSSFAGSGDASTLEDAFTRYDELMEDIEADLSKAKIGLGLRLEESLKRYEKSTDQFFRAFRGPGIVQGSNLPSLNEKELKRRVMQFNEMMNQGFERFLEMSERGKDVLRRLYKRRYLAKHGSPRKPTETIDQTDD